MRSRYLVGAILAIASCASSRVIIERPIADQCETTGLKGCPQLTEGVLLFLEGDQQRARHQLHLAVNANEPEEVLAFADALKTISQLPGAGQFTASIQQVIDILATAAKQADGRSASRRREPGAGRASSRRQGEPDDSDQSERNESTPVRSRVPAEHVSAMKTAVVLPASPAAQWQPSSSDFDGKTVIPAIDETTRACALTGTMWPSGEANKGYCVRVSRGPLVITDLHSPSACPAELFALAVPQPGDLSTPRWAVYAQPANAINVSGGTLTVRDSEYFVIGTMSTSDQKIKRDLRCSITWSGWRPPAATVEPPKVVRASQP
jgi:hypothetical protein